MADLKLGSVTPTALYIGATSVTTVYLGAVSIWTGSGAATLVLGSGSYAYSGSALTLKHSELVLGGGTYAYTGAAVTLTYSAAVGGDPIGLLLSLTKAS